jgi:RNA polymerase sigma-70 factor (ECF subfamily)
VERNALTRLALEPPTLAEGDIERIEAMAELDDLRRDIARALSGISEEQAYCVRQRVLAERSYSELAAELGVTEQVVRARVSRGLRAMAQSLGGDEELEEVA